MRIVVEKEPPTVSEEEELDGERKKSSSKTGTGLVASMLDVTVTRTPYEGEGGWISVVGSGIGYLTLIFTAMFPVEAASTM